MKGLALVIAWLMVTAATMKLSAVAPMEDNKDTTCTVPILSPMQPTQQLQVHFSWAGVGTVTDSGWVWAQPGQTILMYRTVPPGMYKIKGWATNYGKAGCKDSITVFVSETRWPPGPVHINP